MLTFFEPISRHITRTSLPTPFPSLPFLLSLPHTHLSYTPHIRTHTHTHGITGYFTGKVGSAGVDPMAQKIAQTAQLVEMNLR
jgi:hypothetical protein